MRGVTRSLPFGLPWLQAHFHLDALSAFFILAVSGLAAAVSLFAVGVNPRLAVGYAF